MMLVLQTYTLYCNFVTYSVDSYNLVSCSISLLHNCLVNCSVSYLVTLVVS
jgi:hypothetical protein